MVEPCTVDAMAPMTIDVHAFFILRAMLAGEEGRIRKAIACHSGHIYILALPC